MTTHPARSARPSFPSLLGIGLAFLASAAAFACGGGDATDPGPDGDCTTDCACSEEQPCDAGFDCIDGTCVAGGTPGTGGADGTGSGGTGGGNGAFACVGTPVGCDVAYCDEVQGCAASTPSSCSGDAGSCADHDNQYANCTNTFGCESAPPGVCREIEYPWVTCFDIETQSACNAADDCEWYDGACEGVLYPDCDDQGTESQCAAEFGCEWLPSELVTCEGRATGCGDMTSRSCDAQDGCTLDAASCTGTATPCAEIPVSECLQQPGCQLQTSSGIVNWDDDPTRPSPKRADLAPTLFTASRAPRSGSGIDLYIDYAFINRGAVATTAFDVTLVLSTDEIIGNDDDQELFVETFDEPIDPHGTAEWTLRGFLEMDALQVDYENQFYYLAAIIDEANDVAEYDEDNNSTITTSRVFIGPASFDLGVVSASHDQSGVAAPGDQVEFTATIENLSTEKVVSIPVSVYLSSDGTLDGSDRLLCTQTAELDVAPEEEATVTVTCTLPRVRGDYEVLVVVDPADTLADEDRDNNVGVANDGIGIDAPSPDLVITALSSTPSSSPWRSTVTLSATVGNTGPDAAGAFKVGFYVDGDLVCTSNVSSLAAAGSTVSAPNCQLPAGLFPGAYELSAIADYEDAIFEGNDGNNEFVAGTSLTVTQPSIDLFAVSAGLMSPGSSAAVGGTFQAGATIRNEGSATIPAGTKATFYLSSDLTITTSDIEVCSYTLPAFSGGDELTVTDVTCTVPLGTAIGAYYVGVIADPDGEIPESNESNNRALDSDAGDRLTVTN